MATPATPARKRAALAAHSEEATVTAGHSVTQNREVVKEGQQSKAFPVDELPEHVARVRISAGITESLGNFEFVRIDASVEMPCAPNKESILKTKERVAKLVVSFIEEEREKALSDRGEG